MMLFSKRKYMQNYCGLQPEQDIIYRHWIFACVCRICVTYIKGILTVSQNMCRFTSITRLGLRLLCYNFYPLFYSAFLFDFTHLFFYPYPLFFPEKLDMPDHIFPSPFLAHARSGLVSQFFSTSPQETRNEKSITALVWRRPDCVVWVIA